MAEEAVDSPVGAQQRADHPTRGRATLDQDTLVELYRAGRVGRSIRPVERKPCAEGWRTVGA
ncbi:hypothetical protein [Kitasatospora sp. NPDC085464]|uniref:hypothetical protein n=1 Tax=Kitasatospora sp. NPDC085464 TaxID=3364063 RepID=UPI0037CB18CD